MAAIDFSLPHIVIVGAGFGGLEAARSLARAPARVTLVDRNNYHLFQPLLYQVATAGVSPDEIAAPVRAILRRQKNFDFRMAEIQRIDPAHHCLVTDRGDLSYDVLILAAGSQANFFGLDSLARNAFELKDLNDAAAIRNHLLQQAELAAQEPDPAERRARLTFVVAGGGPTGVETSGAISELVQRVFSKDYPHLDLSEVSIILLEAAGQVLAAFPPALSAEAGRVLAKKGVKLRFGSAVAGYDGRQVTLKSGEVISTRTLIWAAGVKASLLAAQLDAPLASQGRVSVLPTLQVPAHPEIFVIGDSAAFTAPDGSLLPMLAPVAIQQAKTAARNARRLLAGQPLLPFRYHDPGTLATIGRNQAVARLGNFQFTGFLAWLLWLGVHIYWLIGFRSRLLVMLDWARDYLFYDRAVRLILPPSKK